MLDVRLDMYGLGLVQGRHWTYTGCSGSVAVDVRHVPHGLHGTIRTLVKDSGRDVLFLEVDCSKVVF